MSLQQDIIAKLGVKPVIDTDEEIRRRVEFLKEYVVKSGVDGLLIAISGGIDSAVAAGLCKIATDELTAEKEGSSRRSACSSLMGSRSTSRTAMRWPMRSS